MASTSPKGLLRGVVRVLKAIPTFEDLDVANTMTLHALRFICNLLAFEVEFITAELQHLNILEEVRPPLECLKTMARRVFLLGRCISRPKTSNRNEMKSDLTESRAGEQALRVLVP